MLLPYLLKVSLLLDVLTLAYRWLIQFETFSKVNRVLLWLNVVAAWTLPLIPLATWGPVEVQREFHQTLPALAQVIPNVSPGISSPSLAPTLLPVEVLQTWGLAEWLMLIYGLGVAYMAFHFLSRLGHLVRALWKRPTRRLENGLLLIQDGDAASPYSFFHEPPLTNSFAQSLLKKRIKMMNRKPSRRLAWGKYALLLATLYVSAAFVAPYRNQLVEMSPAPLQPVVSALVPESVPLVEETVEEVPIPAPKPELADLVKLKEVVEDDAAKKVKSPWVQVQGDTLYWSIPATATLADIDLISKDIVSYGGQISINLLRYDPEQLFLTALTVAIKQKGGDGIGSRPGKDVYTPIIGYWGYVTKGNGFSMDSKLPQPLSDKIDQDYNTALSLAEKNHNIYFEHKFTGELRSKRNLWSSSGYSNESLSGKDASFILEKRGVGKSGDKFLVTNTYEGSNFYINTLPSTFEKVNAISFDQFESVKIIEDRNGGSYFMIYTK